MINNDTIQFDYLSIDAKERIMMYNTARQFKNAVPIEEMLILPSQIGNWVNYCNITISNVKLQDIISSQDFKNDYLTSYSKILPITFRGDKIISKQDPYIVNKSFACEVYLKFILEEENVVWDDLKNSEKHNLWKLYSKLPAILKKDFTVFFKSKGFINADKRIAEISSAFISWRYIYQKYRDVNPIDFLFLNEFCNYLDCISKKIILQKYNYDVDRDTR